MTTRTKWLIDKPHTIISFSVRYLMMTNVTGYFNEYAAEIVTKGDDFLTSSVEFRINAQSIDTHDDTRDEHLRSSDFFDSEAYKEIIFTGKSVRKCTVEDKYLLTGDLTIKDVTREIVLEVERAGAVIDTGGKPKTGFHVTGRIRRSDWNINWNTPLQMGGVMVGDSVQIVCEVQLEPEVVVIPPDQSISGTEN